MKELPRELTNRGSRLCRGHNAEETAVALLPGLTESKMNRLHFGRNKIYCETLSFCAMLRSERYARVFCIAKITAQAARNIS